MSGKNIQPLLSGRKQPAENTYSVFKTHVKYSRKLCTVLLTSMKQLEQKIGMGRRAGVSIVPASYTAEPGCPDVSQC